MGLQESKRKAYPSEEIQTTIFSELEGYAYGKG